ncbi:MAG: DUF3563 family protein [Paracoccaceae bacterium]|nr:DUF3563 family protein [Paracoccaceae bacterium]
MFDQLKSLLRAFRVPSMQEREIMYLNGSLDRVDLEFRQREIDRGLFRRAF